MQTHHHQSIDEGVVTFTDRGCLWRYRAEHRSSFFQLADAMCISWLLTTYSIIKPNNMGLPFLPSVTLITLTFLTNAPTSFFQEK